MSESDVNSGGISNRSRRITGLRERVVFIIEKQITVIYYIVKFIFIYISPVGYVYLPVETTLLLFESP